MKNESLPSLLPVFFSGMPHGYACAVSSGILVLSGVVMPFQSPEGEKGDQEKHLTSYIGENWQNGVKQLY